VRFVITDVEWRVMVETRRSRCEEALRNAGTRIGGDGSAWARGGRVPTSVLLLSLACCPSVEARVHNSDIDIPRSTNHCRRPDRRSPLNLVYQESTSLTSEPSCRELKQVRDKVQKAELQSMLTLTGVLVECDASIKAIIVKINAENGNAYIIEDIDDEHVLIQASKHEELKARLNAVCP
jgi:hypothetical protein